MGCCCCAARYNTTAATIFDDVRGNVAGRTIIITGAGSGIGYETARVLAINGAHLVVPARDERKSAELVRRLRDDTKSDHITGGILELASLRSVRAFAESFIATGRPCHILINNAGIMAVPYAKTMDGFESQMGTNHFGHFLLTHLLLPVLRRSAPSRVVNLSSDAHAMVSSNGIRFDQLSSGPSEADYSPIMHYGQSKLANIYFTSELTRREHVNGVTAYAVHPGVIRTNLFRSHAFSRCCFASVSCCLKTIAAGAATTMYCAVCPGIEAKAGSYFRNAGVDESATRAAANPEKAAQLWDISLQLVEERCPSVPSSSSSATPAAASVVGGYGSMEAGAAPPTVVHIRSPT